MMGTPIKNAEACHRAAEGNEHTQESRPEGIPHEIRVRGQLGPEWSDWFAGLEFKPLEDGQMLLSGRIADQSALIGILIRLNRLNLALLSVRPLGE